MNTKTFEELAATEPIDPRSQGTLHWDEFNTRSRLYDSTKTLVALTERSLFLETCLTVHSIPTPPRPELSEDLERNTALIRVYNTKLSTLAQAITKP